MPRLNDYRLHKKEHIIFRLLPAFIYAICELKLEHFILLLSKLVFKNIVFTLYATRKYYKTR